MLNCICFVNMQSLEIIAKNNDKIKQRIAELQSIGNEFSKPRAKIAVDAKKKGKALRQLYGSLQFLQNDDFKYAEVMFNNYVNLSENTTNIDPQYNCNIKPW